MDTTRPLRLYHDPTTGLTDPLLWRIALTKRTLVISPKFSVGFDGTWKGSPFSEFTCIPASRPTPDIPPLDRKPYTIPEAAAHLLPILRERIAAVWQPEKIHFIYHSSGYDSRVISGLIRSLYQERGDDWLGTTFFITNKWENLAFIEIMARQGWAKEQWYVYGAKIADSLYFLSSIDPHTTYFTLNAPCPIPANLWYYIPCGFQTDNGTIPDLDACQGFSGYWSNETHETFLTNDREWYTRWGYWYSFNVMASLPMFFPHMEFIYPTPEYQTALSQMIVQGVGDYKALRRAMADLACPNCADIPNGMQSDRHHPIDDSIRHRMTDQYRQTWYGKHVCKDFTAPTNSEFSPEWGKWSLASLCEFLLDQGRTINIK